MPREWIVGAIACSVVAAIAGCWIWGGDFVANVVASLVLIGPGLLLTNVVAGNWRNQRLASHTIGQIRGPLMLFLMAIGMGITSHYERLHELLPEDTPPWQDSEPKDLWPTRESVADCYTWMKTGLNGLHKATHDDAIAIEMYRQQWTPVSYPDATSMSGLLDEMSEHINVGALRVRVKDLEETLGGLKYVRSGDKNGPEALAGELSLKDARDYLKEVATFTRGLLHLLRALLDALPAS
jgi:hypothetical protein